MSNVDIERDAPARVQAPIDKDVRVPDSVKRAAALAESFYAAAPADEPAPEIVEANEPAPPPPQAATPPAEVAQPNKDDLRESEWAARYNAMKGRWEANQRTIGVMQEQMQQLGDELVRTQQLLSVNRPLPQSASQASPLVTQEDEQTYGPELIDLATRAARQAVAPDIEELRQRNQMLEKQLSSNARTRVMQTLQNEVPDWATINHDPRFKKWLSLPDIYAGRVRKELLDAALQAADAPRVIAFFKGFIQDGAATGQIDDVAKPLEAPAPVPQPRQAAVPLASLAAPGRARPAPGNSQVPADKPSFTRTQIRDFYNDVRREAYVGREEEKVRKEQAIFAAQREGRITG